MHYDINTDINLSHSSTFKKSVSIKWDNPRHKARTSMFKDHLNFKEPLLISLQCGNKITQCHGVSEVTAQVTVVRLAISKVLSPNLTHPLVAGPSAFKETLNCGHRTIISKHTRAIW